MVFDGINSYYKVLDVLKLKYKINENTFKIQVHTCFEELDKFSLKLTGSWRSMSNIQFGLWQRTFNKELTLPLKTTAKAEQNTFEKHLKGLEDYQTVMNSAATVSERKIGTGELPIHLNFIIWSFVQITDLGDGAQEESSKLTGLKRKYWHSGMPRRLDPEWKIPERTDLRTDAPNLLFKSWFCPLNWTRPE